MIREPMCHLRRCKHFLGTKSDGVEENERVVCKAFPDGIPGDIAYGDNKHTTTEDGQVGDYTYEEE